jgi:ATP-binding cassette subfamily F protein uup
MENREFEQLMNDIQKLEDRKNDINNLFLDANLPHDDIQKLSKEISEIIRNIEIKEARWMELSERV